MTLESLTISDAASGATAKILPAAGFNCYSFVVPGGGEPIEALWTAADFVAGQGKPSHSGIPLLFPFAGRIRGTSFRFEGKRYELEAGDGRGNAIHGFVLNRPWRVTSQSADRVVGTFQASVDEPSLLARWPADFRITADYRVAGNALVTEYLIENPDQKPLPFSFGTHPYFRVPLGKGKAADCRVTVPVEYSWELEGLLPTGKKTPQGVAGELARNGFREDATRSCAGWAGICRSSLHDQGARPDEQTNPGANVRRSVHGLRRLQSATSRGGLHRAVFVAGRSVYDGRTRDRSAFASPGPGPRSFARGSKSGWNRIRTYPKTVSEKGTVPFSSQGTGKSGQSPTVFG